MNSLSTTVLSILGKVSFQVSLLVLLIAFLQWAFQKHLTPRVRAALWLLIVLRLLVPVSFSSTASIFNLFSVFQPDAGNPRRAPVPKSKVKIFIPLTGHNSVPLVKVPVPEMTAGNPASGAGKRDPALLSAAPTVAPDRNPWSQLAIFGFPPSEALLMLWLSGAGILALLVLVSSILWARRLRGLRAISNERIVSLFSLCREQMGVSRQFGLFETPRLSTPALHGFFRPRILFPAGFLSSIPEEQLRFIFLHELGHVQRRDIPLNWLITALQVLYWFNPLVWLAFSRWRLDRELACDALVLEVAGPGRNKEYGRTILRLLEGASHPLAAPGFAGILESKRQLHQRIGLIASFVPSARCSPLAILLIGLLFFAGLTDAPEAKPLKSSVAKKEDSMSLPKRMDLVSTAQDAGEAGLRLSGELKAQTFDLLTGQVRETLTFQFTVDRISEKWRIELLDEASVRGDRENCDKDESAYDGIDIYRMLHFPDKMLEDSLRKNGIRPVSQQGRVAIAPAKAGFPVEAHGMFKFLWFTFCSETYLQQLESNAAPSLSSDLLKPNSTRALYTLLNPIGLPRDYKEFIPGVVMVFQEVKGLVAIPCAPPFDKEYLAMHYSALAATNLNGTVFPSIFRAEYSQPSIGGQGSASNYVSMVLEGKLLAHTALANGEVRPEVNGDSYLRDARFGNIFYVATKPGVSNWLDRASQTLQLEIRSKSGVPIYQRSKTTGKLSEIRED